MQFRQQINEVGIDRLLDLALEAGKHMGSPLAKIGDARGQSVRMQRRSEDVDGRFCQVRGDPVEEWPERTVRGDKRPVTVDGKCRVRLVSGEYEIDRRPCGFERDIVQTMLRKGWGEAGGGEEDIALPERDIESFGEMQEHLAARLSAAGFEDAHMTGRDVGVQCELKLGQVPVLSGGHRPAGWS